MFVWVVMRGCVCNCVVETLLGISWGNFRGKNFARVDFFYEHFQDILTTLHDKASFSKRTEK